MLGSEGQPADLEKALKNMQRAVLIDPRLSEAARAGRDLCPGGQESKAKGRLAYALQMRPDYYRRWRRGAAGARGGRLDQARDLYERA